MTGLGKWKYPLITVTVIIIAVMVAIPFIFPPVRSERFFSFESDMEGWEANGTDLDLGSTTIEWSITRNDTIAVEGDSSIELYMNNLNDQGKIWMERSFEMKPGQAYRVTIEFSFATRDFGSMNLWTILAGAMSERPETADDLVPAHRGKSGNGQDNEAGYIWLEKMYDSDARTGPDGILWVIIGVWGTWETHRTYFVDGVHLTFTEI